MMMPNSREELLFLAEDSTRIRELKKTQDEFLNITTQTKNQYQATEHLKKFSDELKNLQNLQDYFTYQQNTSLKRKYEQAKINIPIPIYRTQSRRPITCDGLIGATKVKFFISCGYWNKLKLSDVEQRAGTFNLLDHLDDLIPKQNSVGLVTFQNGIQNEEDDFEAMGSKICDKIHEGTLCIGLYNPTEGLPADLLRVNGKLNAELSDICCFTYAMMRTFAKLLWKREDAMSYKTPSWCHFAHSEGAIIARLCLIMMEHDKDPENAHLKNFFKTHFIPYTYGAVLPIPTSYVKNAINTYSEKDEATLPRVKRYLESIGDEILHYKNVKIVPCEKLPDMSEELCPRNSATREEILKMSYLERVAYMQAQKARSECDRSFAIPNAVVNYVKGDHDFQGDTYQKALERNITDIKTNFIGFYNGR